MRRADLGRWALGALLMAVGVTAAEADPILLPTGDPSRGLSDDSKLAILFHHRYDDVRIPDAWSQRLTLSAPAPMVRPPGVAVVPGLAGEGAAPGPSGSVAAIPEPSTLLLLGLGVLGTAFARRTTRAG